MTSDALATGFWIVLSVLNFLLLGISVFMLRRMARRLKRLRKSSRLARRKTKASLEGIRAELEGSGKAHEQRFNRSVWPQIESLISLYRLLDGKIEFPPMRRWSASPDFMLHVVGHVRRRAPKTIVECGSGSSTVVLAHLLKSLGHDGHIHSIENHVPTIERVRAELRRHGLERFVTLTVAPLAAKRYDGLETVFHWYDLAPDAIPHDVDLLIVDGPSALINAHARYPAGPELLPRLSRDAHIFIDDADRPDEMAMLRMWRKLYPDLGIRRLPAEKGCCELFFLDRKIEDYLPSEWGEEEERLGAPASSHY
ncbi:MAG TPA: class I SAM-dependent methyltransferase [Dongiaceae bacterium]|nr:class I SAM-dependent methyltransferase [Dongiaceae bacterium]